MFVQATSTAQRRRRRLLGLAVLLAALAIAIAASLAFGARAIPLGEVPDAVGRALAGLSSPDALDPDASVIARLRVPRTVLGVLVGAALGVAGALIQGHTRNPLADPSLLGISAGAGLSVVVLTALHPGSTMALTILAAFAGALVAAAIVFALTSLGGGAANPASIILGGAALSAVLQALTSAIVLLNQGALDRMRLWVVGSVAGRDLAICAAVAPVIVVGIIAGVASAPQLNLLSLGEETARSLGVRTTAARWVGMVIIALLAGAATAAAGPIAFVGLIVPHVVRSVTGSDYRRVVPYSALAGAVLLIIADVVGRVVARPGELQVGITLAFVGAPFMLWLLARRRTVKL